MSDSEFFQYLVVIADFIILAFWMISTIRFLFYCKADDDRTRFWFRMSVVFGIMVLM